MRRPRDFLSEIKNQSLINEILSFISMKAFTTLEKVKINQTWGILAFWFFNDSKRRQIIFKPRFKLSEEIK
jgi:hypothetical protein